MSDILTRLFSSKLKTVLLLLLQQCIRLPNTAKNLTTNLSLNALSCLHEPLVSADEDALANLSQSPDELAILTPNNLAQLITAQPNTLSRLRQQLHLPQHGLAVPVLHAQP